jgi:hypothetical protein
MLGRPVFAFGRLVTVLSDFHEKAQAEPETEGNENQNEDGHFHLVLFGLHGVNWFRIM